jgi:cytochrome c-type biogenesis protein CcmH/NrfF
MPTLERTPAPHAGVLVYSCGHPFAGGPAASPGHEFQVRRVLSHLRCPRCRTRRQSELAWRMLVRAYFGRL